MRTQSLMAVAIMVASLLTAPNSGAAGGALVEKRLGASPISAAPSSATLQTLGSRATVSPSATVFGGFTLVNSTTVYILVRGPSMATLGVTPNALDAPWVRLYNSNNADLVTQGGVPGFTGCLSTATTDKPVVDFYQSVRNAPVQPRDSCIAANLAAGVYTFSVTPSVPGVTSAAGVSSSPSSGEILFEVTLGPTSSEPPNKASSERLLGGTWTFIYTIISTFSDQYRFLSVDSTPNSSGEYFARGTDSTGGAIAGGFDPNLGEWAVLDPSIIIDKFYTFRFTSDNNITGCYYQISPPGSTNLSNCYPLNGARSGFAASRAPAGVAADDDRLLREVGEGGASVIDPAVLRSYLEHRALIAP